jgi:hypothetical protein
MPFKEGNNYGKGRPKGSTNSNRKLTRDLVNKILHDNMEQFQSDLAQLNPRDRVGAIISLMKFVIPVMKSTDITSTNTSSVWFTLPDDEKLLVLDELKRAE